MNSIRQYDRLTNSIRQTNELNTTIRQTNELNTTIGHTSTELANFCNDSATLLMSCVFTKEGFSDYNLLFQNDNTTY